MIAGVTVMRLLTVATLLVSVFRVQAATPVITLLSGQFSSDASKTADDQKVFDVGPDFSNTTPSHVLTIPQNTVPGVQLHIDVDIQPANANGNVQFRATGPVNFISQGYQITEGTGPAGGQSRFLLLSTGNFPTGVQILELIFDFSYSVDGGSWISLGQRQNRFFLTLDSSANATRMRTVLRTACLVPGATTKQAAVESFWTTIKNRNLTTYAGEALKYYATETSYPENPDSLDLLLNYKTGSCYAMREFMEDCFLSHGIALGEYKRIRVQSQPDALYLVIKNWSITGGPTFPPPYLYSEIAILFPPPPFPVFDMKYGAEGDWTPTSGSEGQNSPTPSQKVFTNHGIILYNGAYYDPSYGLKYTGRTSFMDQTMRGRAISEGSDPLGRPKIGIQTDIFYTDIKFVLE